MKLSIAITIIMVITIKVMIITTIAIIDSDR